MKEDPSLNRDVGVGCAAGEDGAEFGADYDEDVDLARGAERELTDCLSEALPVILPISQLTVHCYCMRPLNDFDVDLVVGGYVDDVAHEYLAQSIGFEGLKV